MDPQAPRLASLRRVGSWAVLPASLALASPAAAQDCSELSGDDYHDIQLFRHCLKEFPSPDDWTAPSGITLLHSVAALTHNPTIVILLLEAGFDSNARDDDGLTPLHAGAGNANPVVTSHLLLAGADPNAVSNWGYTPLHNATSNENERVIKLLLDAGADPNALSNDGWTPFYSAIFFGRSVDLFLEAGADVGLTPLQQAVLRADTRTTASLLAQGTDPDGADKHGWTALHFSASMVDRRSPSALLEAGANPNVRTSNGLTALHIAADPEAVRALVAAGAEVDARNDIGRTPLHQAANFRSAEVVESLLNAGADPTLEDNEGNRPVDLVGRNARIEEDSEVVRRLRGF